MKWRNMLGKIKDQVSRLSANFLVQLRKVNDETALMALGAMLSKQQALLSSTNINDYEFKIFSQFGDDGIIQYLVKNVAIENEVFIEFGVENYLESNTRFLMMYNNWKGFVMDGSPKAMNSLKKRDWYWKHDLTHKAVFIDKDNINGLLHETGFRNIGLLHIDLDGNDYYIFKAIDLSKLNPAIVILEYNSVLGAERCISIPYDPRFQRTKAHYSNLFYGASLPALNHAAVEKGYSLVGCNVAGNNAYFVRNDLLNPRVQAVSVRQAYVASKFREGRERDGALSFLAGEARLKAIEGLEVYNTETNQLEKL